MGYRVLRGGLVAAALVGAGLVAAADDAKSPGAEKAESAKAAKAPGFTGYTTVTTVTGEIVEASEKSATIRVYWQHPTAGGQGTRRPSLSQSNGRSMVNPSARRSNVRLKTEHHDYVLEFLPQSLVRTKALPPKTDADGKAAAYTAREQAELRSPPGAPGYAAATADLTAGTIVEAVVVRDRTLAAAKVTEDDLRLKYVVIVGHDPKGAPSGAPAKKK